MSSIRSYVRENWLWLLANIGSMAPLLWLLWDQLQDNLSINPIDDYTDRTGSTAIILLLLSLAVTPVQTVTGWRKVSTIRKSLGLWAFAYAVLHMLVFVGLDYGFSLEFILLDGLPSKPYILVGLSALLILLPLALTSTKGMQKRLGKNWKKLHRWVYAAGLLAVIHYIWVAKVAFGEPTLYAIILGVLLAARLPTVRKWLSGLRPKRAPQTPAAARKRPKVAAEAADM
jgi:sulfoxide reductase heme-binding subunit YedZ